MLKLNFTWYFLAVVNINLIAYSSPVEKMIENNTELISYIEELNYNGIISVRKGNETLIDKAFGVKNIVTQEKLVMADRFQIGSITKQFVAAGILKLIEENKISLSDQVSKFIPAFLNLEPMTIKNLLNHASGLVNFTEIENFWELATSGKLNTDDDLINLSLSFPLKFKPGSEYKYSNTNYIVAGRIIEIVSGEPWINFIKIKLLNPLNMTNTGYESKFSKASEVSGHIKNSEGQFEVFPDFELRWASAAGGIYSTAEDMQKWCNIYSNANILSVDSKKEFLTPYLNNYALGVKVLRAPNMTRVFHDGKTPGFGATLDYLIEKDLCIVTFNNFDGNIILNEVLYSFFTNGKFFKLKNKKAEDSIINFQDFYGYYEGSKLKINVYSKDDNLIFFPEGQKEFTLLHVDKDSFVLPNIFGDEFLRDENGKVYAIKHYQNGTVSVFKKVQ